MPWQVDWFSNLRFLCGNNDDQSGYLAKLAFSLCVFFCVSLDSLPFSKTDNKSCIYIFGFSAMCINSLFSLKSEVL